MTERQKHFLERVRLDNGSQIFIKPSQRRPQVDDIAMLLGIIDGEETPTNIMRQFVFLVNQMSPENLVHDGERTQAQMMKARKEILDWWKILETQIGRYFSQADVHNWLRQNPIKR